MVTGDSKQTGCLPVAQLRAPQLLLITRPGGHPPAFGGDQTWYASRWQRQSGCGPTTAATLLAYLAQTCPQAASLLPSQPLHYDTFVPWMQQLWGFVTPDARGVHKADRLLDGVLALASSHQLFLEPHVFLVPAATSKRPPWDSCLAFIKDGLEQNSPVAFLNRSRGRLTNLESWHWVTITALCQTRQGTVAEVSDSGERKTIKLSLWYQSSRLGGDLVWFSSSCSQRPTAPRPNRLQVPPSAVGSG